MQKLGSFTAKVSILAGILFCQISAQAQTCGSLFGPGIPQTIRDLHPAVRRWLSIPAEQRSAPRILNSVPLKKPGDFVEVLGQSYMIVAYLRSGFEVDDYLVQTPEGLRSAKVISKPDLVDPTLRVYQTRKDIRLPSILAIDRNKSTILMEYVEGISFDYILKHVEDFGLTRARIHWLDGFWSHLSNRSLVYSFKYDDLRPVDPY